MANKRMIAKMIVDSDAFLDMPQSTQNLYFHLNMHADDEGFIDNPKKIMRVIGSAQNDLEILLAKRYLLMFESGVIVIKHWKLHNCIRKDRVKPTIYQEEKKQIIEKENGAYTNDNLLADKELVDCQTSGRQVTDICTHRLDQYSIDKSSIDKSTTLPVTPSAPKSMSPMKDPIANHYQNLITAVQPYTSWGDIGKERQQLTTLAKKTLALLPAVPYTDSMSLADAIIKTFLEMREFGHWKAKDKPVIPSSVSTAWAEIITQLAEGYRTVDSVGVDEEIIF